ncbi:UNVERIFIED_CONTAM: hypothetical protein NCL1_23535 [Trichonephila clavipes]
MQHIEGSMQTIRNLHHPLVAMKYADCAHSSDGSLRHITKLSVQQILSVTHHSVSTPIIRCRLQQNEMSTRLPLLRLPLTGNYRHLRRQWCKERWTWIMKWNDIVLSEKS